MCDVVLQGSACVGVVDRLAFAGATLFLLPCNASDPTQVRWYKRWPLTYLLRIRRHLVVQGSGVDLQPRHGLADTGCRPLPVPGRGQVGATRPSFLPSVCVCERIVTYHMPHSSTWTCPAANWTEYPYCDPNQPAGEAVESAGHHHTATAVPPLPVCAELRAWDAVNRLTPPELAALLNAEHITDGCVR
jgi:hypothetical protein